MELFTRKSNLSLRTRNWKEISSETPAIARGLVNRTAFEIFRSGYEAGLSLSEYIGYLEEDRAVRACEQALIGINVLDLVQRAEAAEIARRMWLHFSNTGRPELIVNPLYKGCGIINYCNGDALTPDGKVIEFKDGDRAFRSYEFRQLSIYSALFLNEHGCPPSAVEVLNSRRGVYVRIGMEEFAGEVAGQSAVDYLREIIRVITDESPSR